MGSRLKALLVSAAIVGLAAGAEAQTPARPATPAPGSPAPPDVQPAQPPASPAMAFAQVNAQQTREQFRNILRQHPPTLWQILRLDPALLNDADYLAAYPALTAYIRAHPEITRNPGFYLGAPDTSFIDRPRSAVFAMEMMFQALMVLTGFVAAMGFLAWVIKTAVDYRRWLRLSKVQTDTHTKLVDRLTANEDLLAYVQSPAGQRFLQGGPVAADPPRAIGAPYGRILWSVQAGTVVMLLGGGLLFISRRLAADPELVEAWPIMFMLGVVAATVGIGFLLSAVIAYAVSHRLGLLGSGAASSHA